MGTLWSSLGGGIVVWMGTYRADDGATLTYRESGGGRPLIVVPGGPGRDAAYLEEFGALGQRAERELLIMEPRGTGASPPPSDLARCAALHLADDLEALREDLGLESFDLVAHSAGCCVALLYAAARPERIGRLLLITPSTRALGLEVGGEDWEAQLDKRRREPWFGQARAALDEIEVSGFTPERRQAMTPLLYGRWDARAQRHAASDAEQRNVQAAAHFWDDLPSPANTRAALRALRAPVRILTGELDLAPGPVLASDVAALFQDARVIAQPDAGHFPWVDDPDAFVGLATAALTM